MSWRLSRGDELSLSKSGGRRLLGDWGEEGRVVSWASLTVERRGRVSLSKSRVCQCHNEETSWSGLEGCFESSYRHMLNAYSVLSTVGTHEGQGDRSLA